MKNLYDKSNYSFISCDEIFRCKVKLGDFGLPTDFGPHLPIPWLPPEIVSRLDRTRIIHRPESDVWLVKLINV